MSLDRRSIKVMAGAASVDGTEEGSQFLIIGCGLGGLATAIGVRRAGHRVTILEKAAELHEVGAGINVSPNATRIFQNWGLLGEIKEKGIAPFAAFMRSYKDSSELSVQYLGCQMEELYSAPYIVIHRADLHNILLQEAERLGVHISLDCQIAKINFTEPSVELSCGELISSDVILGADGERSMCRDALLNHVSSFQDSGDHVFRITVDANEVAKHRDLADLIQPPSINFWVGPGAHAISYALKRDGLLNIVLTCEHDASTTAQHGPLQADMAEVRQAFSQWDAKFQAVLDIAQGCSKWNLFEAPEATYWTHPDGKFTLLGDSAHAMLPFVGQGAAMAVEDAAVLGALLSKMQHRAQIPDMLFLYERLRKPRTKAIRDRARAIREVYTLNDGPLQQQRDRHLRELVPYEGYPNFLADPSLQRTLFGYDATEEAEKAWSIHLNG